MALLRDISAVLGLLSILGSTSINAFPIKSPLNGGIGSNCNAPLTTSTCNVANNNNVSPQPSSSTSLNNMLRNYADYNYSGGYYDDNLSRRSERSGASSTNWRKNQGYNLSKPTPLELGGSYSSIRDTETNPYYDPGWAQSVRRDNPSQNFQSNSMYNGYNDPMNPQVYGGSRSYQYPSTFPGMTNPRKTDKMYTNPTNPYYDPVWSQSYDSKYGYRRNDEPIREGDHTAYYAPGYDRNYYNGMGYMDDMDGYYPNYGYGGRGYGGYYGRGGGGMYAKKLTSEKKGLLNGNSLMRTKKSTLFQSRATTTTPRGKSSALQMSYFDGGMMGGGWGGGPMFDGPGMMPPPGYGMMPRPGMRQDMTFGTAGGYSANDMNNPNYYRRGGASGFRRGGMPPGGRMRGPGAYGGIDPFVRPEMMGPFGRDMPMGRMSLKDMAARSPGTKSFDAEVINSMNTRGRAGSVRQPVSRESFGVEAGGERRGATTSTTSTSEQYVPLSNGYGNQPPMTNGYGREFVENTRDGAGVPLSSVYGPGSPRGPPVMDRSPPLSGMGMPPPGLGPQATPIIDTSAVRMGEIPSTIQAARNVRPSVVLVTSKGARKENSQGSGFVVAFDDSAMEEQEDEMKDRVHILTSAHVAPPGWKVSVTFPGDPDKQYPATVVGRKLNSDLALLCVETVADENDDYPFPPPIVMSGEEVSTDTSSTTSDGRVPTSEIGSPVFAFGYPMGVEGPTMTSGILSATTNGINYMDAPTGEEASEISKSRPFENTAFVITDAAMAGGMSGGPLVNNEGVVLGINALVRPDLRALGNYAVSALECETFLEKLEDKRSEDAGQSRTTKRVSVRTAKTVSSSQDNSEESTSRGFGKEPQASTAADEGVAGYRVMLYGYSTDKADATRILRRVAGLDQLRAENAMRSATSFGAGVVDEFYVAESGNRERAVKAARKSADELLEKLKEEGMMAEVEPLNLLK